MIKVLIADDHQIFRKGLKHTIDDVPGMRVTGEAGNGKEVLSKVANNHYDVVILDIAMPGPSGVEILKQLKSENPSLSVLVLSMYPEEQYALRVMKAGAAGYLTKDADEEKIVEAIHKIHRGGKYVTPTLAEKLAFAFQLDFEKQAHETLSDREYEVMCLIAAGNSIGDIAKRLNLALSTISTYRSRILEKTGLRNNAEITNYAFKHGLIG